MTEKVSAPDRRLRHLPLWRLLVAFAYAERESGPDSPTVRVLARTAQERLRGPLLADYGTEASHES